MNRIFVTLSFLLTFLCPMLAQEQVKFLFSDGINNSALKEQVECNVSKLLSEINKSSKFKKQLYLDGIQIGKDAAGRLRCLWYNMPFSCEWKLNVQPCLRDFTEYEIRNIPILVKPVVDKGKKELHDELVITFDKNGIITSVRMAMNHLDYLKLQRGGKNRNDVRMRREILKQLECFRSYYLEKNIGDIEQFMNADAFVIVDNDSNIANGIKRMWKDKQRFAQKKNQLLSNLRQLFLQKGIVAVEISDIELQRHGGSPYAYAVLFRLTLSQDKFKEMEATDGYYFQIWDFSEEGTPKILLNVLSHKKALDLTVEDFFLSHY